MPYTPKNLLDAVRYFSDKAVCNDYMKSIKWPDGLCCHHCGSVRVGEIKTRSMLPLPPAGFALRFWIVGL